jgi:hypothetical protein
MTTPIRRLGGALAITLLSIGLAACGGSTPSVTTTAAPPVQVSTPPVSAAPSEEASPSVAASAGVPGASLATTGRIEVADKGFALTLPAGWTRVDVTASDMDKMMEAAGIADPNLAAQYSAQVKAMLAAGLSVFAFGPDPTKGTNLNVITLPGAGLSLDLLEQVNKSQIEAIAGPNVTVERVTLPAGDAIHYRYEIKPQGSTTGTSIDQYLMLVGDNQLVVTATNATAAEATAIANSIEATN